MTSPYELKMIQNEPCKALCDAQVFDPRAAEFVNGIIAGNYNLNFLVDGLPAGMPYNDSTTDTKFVMRGFRLGYVAENGLSYLNNHYDIMVDYHEFSKEQYRVVGVTVIPYSRKDNKNLGEGKAECGETPSTTDSYPNGDTNKMVELNEKGDTSVTWTYSVIWRPSKTAWATRWDSYLHVYDPKIHWFSLVNSAVIVVFLCGMVSAILMRTLKKDIARYNRLDQYNLDDLSTTQNGGAEDGIQEDSGWKLVHGDVFRPPPNPLLLSIFLGNGSQIFVMVGTTIVFALFGFLSPSNRGSLATVMILLYTIFSFIGGYVSARVYKNFSGDAWKKNIALTPTLIPGLVFVVFFLLNLLLWLKGSSGAVPFTTMLVILGIWFIISLPLSFAGSWAGFKHVPIPSPVRVNQIPRQIPPSITYLKPLPSMALVGILPFGAIFVELFFIMNSLWQGRLYYMFGFLLLSYSIMIMTCMSVTVLLVYFLLCAENYHWQWRSFCTAGASAGYVFANAMVYWVMKLKFGSLVSSLLYVGYSALLSFLFFILTGKFNLRQVTGCLGTSTKRNANESTVGTIGFFSSWLFVHRIYGSIKVD